MSVSAPPSNGIDLALPSQPNTALPGITFDEFMRVYQAIRNLQASIIPQYSTANRPTYKKGLLIYDTTLGKLVVGGAAAWEVVTSV